MRASPKIPTAFAALALIAAPPSAYQTLSETLKITASDGAATVGFGRFVAVSGTTLVVGAPWDFENGSDSGSAYVFDTTTGTELFKLTASDGSAAELFGWSVAVSGATAIVGAQFDDENGSSSGSAYVFDTTTGTELFKLTASDGAAGDRFGWSVAVSGTHAVIGAYGDDDNGQSSGSAYVFDMTTGTELFKLLASDGAAGDNFGTSVAVSGTTAVVGAPWDDDNGTASGAAYLFDITTGTELQKLTASDGGAIDEFGTSVAVSGSIAAVGAAGDDDSGMQSGSAYVFDLTTGTELFKLTASDGAADDRFGWSVAVSGTRAVIGAYGDDDSGQSSGSAYVFDMITGTERFKLMASDGAAGDKFGASVAVSGPTAAVGAYDDDDNGQGSGSAYVFDLPAPPTTYYCTAGTSASGCQAGISAWPGGASATASAGFVLSAVNVEGAKDGLFFFGANGGQTTPWGNGTSYQCVTPPVKRGGLMSAATGSTAGSCDGHFSQDLNALWCTSCPKPLHNPGAGATVQAQLWYRDPQNTSNQTTSLSDAIEFTVGP